jgi:diaminopimelate decarboxylase
MPVALPLSDEELLACVREFGTPLQLYDEALIRKQAGQLVSTMQSRFAPEGLAFRQYYAVKALPNPVVLRILAQEVSVTRKTDSLGLVSAPT